MKPGSPFFPAGYQNSTHNSFSIGLECSALLNEACEATGGDISLLKQAVENVFNPVVTDIERLAKEASSITLIVFL